jgi:hypothetical protein
VLAAAHQKPVRSKDDELSRGVTLTGLHRKFRACSILIRFTQLLLDQSQFLIQNQADPNQIAQFVPYIQSLIWGAQLLDIRQIDDFRALIGDSYGKTILQGISASKTIDLELRGNLEPSVPNAGEIASFWQEFAKKYNLVAPSGILQTAGPRGPEAPPVGMSIPVTISQPFTGYPAFSAAPVGVPGMSRPAPVQIPGASGAFKANPYEQHPPTSVDPLAGLPPPTLTKQSSGGSPMTRTRPRATVQMIAPNQFITQNAPVIMTAPQGPVLQAGFGPMFVPMSMQMPMEFGLPPVYAPVLSLSRHASNQ